MLIARWKMSKKEILAYWLSRTRLLELAGPIRRSPRLIILAYHRVMDFNARVHSFDSDLISAFVEEFERQMDHVKRNFNVITFETWARSIEEERYPERSLIVTFDDGYRDNYLNAYPILKRRGIPATFFLAVRYIGTKEIFNFEKAAYLIKQAQSGDFSLEADQKYRYHIPSGDRTRLIEEIQALLKRADPRTHESIIHQMEGALKANDYPMEEVEMMTWEEVREMAKNGMEIGSHGMCHINMTLTSDQELREEIVDSKQWIEKEIGRPVSVLAYPFGQGDSFDERVKGAVEQAGYTFAASYIHGADVMGKLDRFGLKRLHVESYITMDYFKSMLAFPSLF